MVAGRSPGLRLRAACRRSGLTLDALAYEAAISRDTLKKIQSGRRLPLTTTAMRLARALDLEVEDLFTAD